MADMAHGNETEKSITGRSRSQKFWAIACVIGALAFATFGYIAVAGALENRVGGGVNYVLALLGLAVAVVSWFQIMAHSPRMHRKRAAARARLEEEFRQENG